MPVSRSKQRLTGWLAIGGVLMVAYLLAFFSVPIHRLSLARVILPDQVFAEMAGEDFSRIGIADRLPILVAVLAVLLSAGLCGSIVIRWANPPASLTRLEYRLLSLAVGLGLIATLALLLGLAGIGSSPWPYLLAITVAASLSYRQSRQPSAAASLSTLAPDRQPVSSRSRLLLVPLAVVIVAGAMLPPLDFDVREYHMQMPREWHQQGQVTFAAHNVYGNMPLGVEILSLPVMAFWPGADDWWWGSLTGKTLVGCFAVLTGLLLLALGQRFGVPHAGLAAAVIYLATPWVGLVSMNGLIDAALGFYLLACFAALLAWDDTRVGRWPAVIGVLAGAAAACKYPGLLWGVAPAGLTLLLTGKRRYRSFALFMVGVAVTGGVWHVKNMALAGNPFYPLWDHLLGGQRTADQVAQWSAAHRVPPLSLSALATSLFDFAGRDNFQSFILVPAALLAIPLIRQDRWLRGVAIYAVFFFASWWLFTHRIPRFWVPVLPFVALLGGVGLANLLGGRPRVLGGALAVTTLVGLCVLTARVPFESSIHDNRFLVSMDQLRRGSIREDEPDDVPLIRMHRLLNEKLPPDSTLLLVGDAEPFDLEMNVLYNTCFDTCILEEMLKGRSRQQRREQLAQAGVTHLFVQWNAIERYRQPGNYGFTDYVTAELLHEELVGREQLLQPVELDVPPKLGELFEVTLPK